MSDTEMVNFDEPTLERLKVAYEDARLKVQEQFTFDGREYLTAYARHLIKFLEGEFEKRTGNG